jgi:transcriptional regulator
VYSAAPFQEQDRERLAAVVRRYAFATLVSGGAEPCVSHVPLQLAGGGCTLVGHVARANPHWKAFDGRTRAVAAFVGPHAYVSPRWYAEAPAVPTWNYLAVQVRGTPRVLEDPDQALAVLRDLTDAFERDTEGAWRLDDQPAGFVERMRRGIVAFEMPIDAIDGAFKLSQNKSEASRRGVVRGLREGGASDAAALAALMVMEE